MKKYQGYISSREVNGGRTPQHIQNIVIRDYCLRNDYKYLLSATEYAMKDSYLILEHLTNNLFEIDGIVAYSLFQMPANHKHRIAIFKEIIKKEKSIHFACERLAIHSEHDIERIEIIILLEKILPFCQKNFENYG